MANTRAAVLAYPAPEILRIEHSQANPLKLSLAWDPASEMPSGLTLRAEIHPSRTVADDATPLAAVTLAITDADTQPWTLEFSSQQTNLDLGGRDQKPFVLTISGIESPTRFYTLADADLVLFRHPCSQLVPAAVSPLLYATTEDLDDLEARVTVIEETGGGGGATNLSRTLAATSVTIASDTGTDAVIPAADGTNAGVFPSALHTKLTDLPTAAELATSLSGKSNTGHAHSLTFSGNVTGSGATGTEITLTIANGVVTFANIAPAAIGTGPNTLAAGNDSRFHAAVTLAASLGGVFQLSTQQLQAVTDIGGDRIVFLDQSANALAYLVVGEGLSLTGTTLTAPAGGTGSEIQIRNSVTGAAAGVAGTSVDGTTIILGAADNLGTGTAERLRLRNITPAATGAPQNSPAVVWEGSAWNPVAGASQPIEYRSYLIAQAGASTPAGRLVFEARTNLGTWTEVAQMRFGFGSSGLWTTSGFGTASATMPFIVNSNTQALQLGATGGWVLGPFAVRAGGVDATFTADAAHIFALRNGTNAQTLRVYDTFGSTSDYHRVSIATVRATLSGLSGASVTAAGLIPPGAVVMGVTAKVGTAITGAASWQLGTAADPDRFAAAGGTALGSTTDNRNWTAGAVECFPTGADVILTANGGNFAGGSVYISVQFWRGEAD